jgi:hypothetical protein
VKTPLGLAHQLARCNTVQEETARDPPQHVLLSLRKHTIRMGTTFSKEVKYEQLPHLTNIPSDTTTWLESPMCARNCEPLKVPDTNILVFYSKRDFYPVVIRTQSENAILNTVLYLGKGLREYCLCNLKNTLRIFIIDVIDQCPVIERVKIGRKAYIYASFLSGPFSYVRYKNVKRGRTVSRRAKLVDRIQHGPITQDYFRTIIDEPSCKGHH